MKATSPPRASPAWDNRIAGLGQGPAPDGWRTAPAHDMTGLYAMPGLIDTHAHITLGPVDVVVEDGQPRLKALQRSDIVAYNGRELLAAGVGRKRGRHASGAAPLGARPKLLRYGVEPRRKAWLAVQLAPPGRARRWSREPEDGDCRGNTAWVWRARRTCRCCSPEANRATARATQLNVVSLAPWRGCS